MMWRIKIIIKIILARIPISYSIWRILGIFRHGRMLNVDYAVSVFNKHYHLTGFDVAIVRDWVGLELGPGDSLISSIIARKNGASRTYLVDAGDYANKSVKKLNHAFNVIFSEYERVKIIGTRQSVNDENWSEFISMFGAVYMTSGIESLRKIESCSVDFIWSQAVLEHVRVDDFDETMRELYRILKPTGRCSHRVDLRDHLGGGKNNLRFSKKKWESELYSRSGFYTNRLRQCDIIAICEKCEFHVEYLKSECYQSKLPLDSSKLSHEFKHYSRDDLMVSGFNVVLSKKNR
jgi:SAM-dependent methyltransferase